MQGLYGRKKERGRTMNFYSLIFALSSNQKIKVIAESDKKTEKGYEFDHILIYEGDASELPIQVMCDYDPPDLVRLEIHDSVLEIYIVG